MRVRVPGLTIAAGAVSRTEMRTFRADWSTADLVELGHDLTLPEPPGPRAEAAVVFTSGATGPAKGVVYRHGQLEAQRDALTATYGITGSDALVAAFAPWAVLGPALGIASAVPEMKATSAGSLEAQALADAAAAVDATLVWASPAALTSVLATADALDARGRAALGRIRTLMSAGAPVPAPLLRRVLALMPAASAHTPYGMTEALPVADIDLEGIEAAGDGDGVCVGHPIAGVQVRVSPLDAEGDADGELTAEPGVVGEICVCAAHVKDRYDRLYATERDSSRNPGWHRTGDVGHLDDEGRLWVEGRLVHVIVTADGVVTPVGVEHRVQHLDRVRLAAAVGVGPRGTAQVVVVVETAGDGRAAGPAPLELTSEVREAAGVPVAAVLTIPRLPVDARRNSKIDRTLVARWAEALLAGRRSGH